MTEADLESVLFHLYHLLPGVPDTPADPTSLNYITEILVFLRTLMKITINLSLSSAKIIELVVQTASIILNIPYSIVSVILFLYIDEILPKI